MEWRLVRPQRPFSFAFFDDRQKAGEVVESSEGARYVVVFNDEEQYSIWLEGQDVPAGWHIEGKSGSREECLAHIEMVWTDMRPLSLRRRMDSADV